MPELPEVETVKLQLQKYLVGHTIKRVEVKNPRLFQGDPNNIEGSKVKYIRRFAKVLSIDLSTNFSIVIHIKLTGQLIYRGPNLASPGALSKKVVGGIPGPHTHVIFHLDRGGILYYNDVRQFGWLKVMKTPEVEKTGFVSKLGPEPFVGETSSGQALVTKNHLGQVVFTLDLFEQILSKTKRAVKVVLMDQSKIGGVGNIYANDALWLAEIDPKRASNSLGIDEIKKLYDAIHTVLKSGLKYGGASELAFVTPDGAEGEYQNHTLAYGHEGTLCSGCKKTKFEKYFLSGRGTYWCPACQR